MSTLDTEPEMMDDRAGSTESAAQKRTRLMASGDQYRQSVPHQVAAQTWAVVQLAEATEAQNQLLDTQNQLLARQVQALEKQAAFTLMQVQLALYSAHPQQFPAGVLEQMKANAQISREPGHTDSFDFE